MKYLFIPRWSGDFRLEAAGDVCKLTVVDPTSDDVSVLEPFFEEARVHDWVGLLDGVQRKGRTEIEIKAPIVEVAPVLAKIVAGKNASWSALRFESGKVEVHDGILLPAEKGDEPKVEAAAIVKPPNRGCPEPTTASRRASTVLRTFSTASQWESFQRNGFLTSIGNVTGRAYRVWHKDEAWRRGHRRCLTIGALEKPVCVWQEDVPPEEQALALKLAVEHREAWLLTVGDGLMIENVNDIRRYA